MQIVDAVAARLGPRSRLAILDHVGSLSAVVFPVRELASLCHKAGANVLIDGARSGHAVARHSRDRCRLVRRKLPQMVDVPEEKRFSLFAIPLLRGCFCPTTRTDALAANIQLSAVKNS
jgi:hypothetical protein